MSSNDENADENHNDTIRIKKIDEIRIDEKQNQSATAPGSA